MDERLAIIERQQIETIVLLRELAKKVDDRIEHTDHWRGRIERIVYGRNGSAGLMVKIALLEDAQYRHRWLLRTLFGTLIVLVGGGIWSLVIA